MSIKVLLLGGIGNQLFQINRALSLKLEGQEVEIIYLGRLKKLISIIIGHPNHKNWIDLNKLCQRLNLKTNHVNLIDLIKLFYIFFLKKINLYKYFDIPLNIQIAIKKKFDLGYFQQKNHYIEKSKELIINNLIMELDIKSKISSKNKIIGFHLRGGDFMKDFNNIKIIRRPNFKNINMYLNDLKNSNAKFFIITNDKNLFLESLDININNFYSSDELNDFLKLIQCNLMYVSQSTYCFWAYLISKKINGCKIINLENWFFKKLI